MGDGSGGAARFERAGSTLRFGRAGARTAVSVCSPRIIRVNREVEGQVPGPSHLEPRTWTTPRFDAIDGEPVRLSTGDLRSRSRPTRCAWRSSTPRVRGCCASRPTAECRARVGGTARRRVRACFAFSGEQHFYGLGQGGGELDRLGTTRQLWNTQLGHGPGLGHGRPAARVQPRLRALLRQHERRRCWRSGRSDDGVRIAYTAEAGRARLVLPHRSPTCAASWARSPSCSAARRCRRAGRSASSSRPATSTTPTSCGALPRTMREKRIPCDALDLSLDLRRGAQGWNRGVGHLEFQPDALAGAGRAARRGARAALRGHHARVPGAPRGVAAVRRGRGARLSAGRPATSGGAGGVANYREGQRYLDFSNPAARAWWWAAHRELVRARRRRLVARRRRGAAGRARSSPPATARALHNIYDLLPPSGLRRGRGRRSRPTSASSCSAARARPGMQRFGAATLVGRHQQRLSRRSRRRSRSA